MIHRVFFWEVLPIMTCVSFGLLTGVFFDIKWAMLLCILILGLLACEAGIESSFMEEVPETKKPTMVLDILAWFIAYPLTIFVKFTIASVLSNIHFIVFGLMLVGSIIAIVIICVYAKHIWKDIKYFEYEV